MQLFKTELAKTELGIKVADIEVVLNMEVGLDPRLGGTIPEQVEALAVVDAFKAPGDEWRIPLRKGLLIEDLAHGLPSGIVACGEYADLLEAAPPLEAATAILMVDPIEASSLLLEAYTEALALCGRPEASDLRDKIGSALEEWGLLPEGD